MPKRYNNLHKQICTRLNIEIADDKARLDKANRGIIKHDKHRDEDNIKLLNDLSNLTYKTSEYTTFEIYEPKKRVIHRLPYYPDRICHHAILNVLEPIWVKSFISHTYSCIKGRGIHKLAKDIKQSLQKDKKGTRYCLKLDIAKFYPSIDHNTLKYIIRKKLKDKALLTILDEIIDSTDGVPIGNDLSRFFANLYLTYFDHWLKEEVKVKYYYRYADDIVVLSDNKEYLRKILVLIKIYVKHVLYLNVKSNYQIFEVDIRGIDFVGYVFYHTHILLRKSIKLRLFRLIRKWKNKRIDDTELERRLTAYFGWLKYCDSKNLLRQIEKDTSLHYSNWVGNIIKISTLYDKNINIVDIDTHRKYYKINFIYKGKPYTTISKNKQLHKLLTTSKYTSKYKLRRYVKCNKISNKRTVANVAIVR